MNTSNKVIDFIRKPLHVKMTVMKQIMYPILHKRIFGCIGRQSIIIKPISLINTHNLFIEDYVTIFNSSRIELIEKWNDDVYTPRCDIGKSVVIGQNFHLTCANKVCIGDNCAIANNVTITDISHNRFPDIINPISRGIECSETIIGENVLIGANVVILPGAHIGDGVVVGANSVVTKGTIPPHKVIAGSPAVIVKD